MKWMQEYVIFLATIILQAIIVFAVISRFFHFACCCWEIEL